MSGRGRWLLALYPRAWRARYGEEMAALLAQEPLSIQLLVDVVAGAVDARIDPSVKAALTRGRGEGEAVMEKTMKLRCAGYGPHVTVQDQRRSVAVTIGATLVLTLAWLLLHLRWGDNPYVGAFAVMPFMAGMMLGTPFTYLKGRSRASQVACIAAALVVLTGIFLVAGFVASRI